MKIKTLSININVLNKEKMKNLIIVGNGFDLAHNLETNYSDFKNDIKKILRNMIIYNTITIY